MLNSSKLKTKTKDNHMKNALKVTGLLTFLTVAFLNAFVDLGHKIIIQNTIFKNYDGSELIVLSSIVNGLILLPFILLFTPTGYISDKYPKSKIMRISAWVAVGITILITFSYYQGWFWVSFGMTFLLALQSAFYSPAKYGYVKELVGDRRLTQANGLLQAVTTTGILLGTFFFSLFFEKIIKGFEITDKDSLIQMIAPLGWVLVVLSIFELIMAYRLPQTTKTKDKMHFRWDDYLRGKTQARNIRLVKRHPYIWLSILGLAVFWAISQVLLATYPAYAKEMLGITNTAVVQGLMAFAGLGVMIGLNIQTSFLTPPFGFALFYLRGVADKVIKTMDIYKGAIPFIALQLLGLAIVGFFPSLVNYLPNRSHLLSETAPPPLNPKLQICLEEYTMEQYASTGDQIKASIEKAKSYDVSYLPEKTQTRFKESIDDANKGLELVETIKTSKAALDTFVAGYLPLQKQVLYLNSDIKNTARKINEAEKELSDLASDNALVASLEENIKALKAEKQSLEDSTPKEWEARHKEYKELAKKLKKDRRSYFNTVDSSTESLQELQLTIADSEPLNTLSADSSALDKAVMNMDKKAAMAEIKKMENTLGKLKGTSTIKSALSKARRVLKKDKTDEAKDKAMAFMQKSHEAFQAETTWRKRANSELLANLKNYEQALSKTIGIRLQERLTEEQAKGVASCMSHHKDLSLDF